MHKAPSFSRLLSWRGSVLALALLAFAATTQTASAVGTADGTINIGTTTLPSSQVGVWGNISIGASYYSIAAPTNGAIIQGSVGIGTSTPLNAFDVYTGGIHIGNSTPSSTANALYAIGTSLMWNGASIGSGGGGGTPGGSNSQVQFNNSSAFGGDSKFSWDNTNKLLTVGTGSTSPTTTNGTVATSAMNIIPQAVTYSISSASGLVTINSAATGQMTYYSGANAISGTTNLYVSGSNIGIGTSNATYLLSLDGQAARTIGMQRDYTAATVGQNLTVQAGGGTSAGTNLNGGNLVLSGGISTGTGTSNIQFQTYPGVAASTTDNTPTTAMTITGAGNVAIGTATASTALQVNGTVTATTFSGAHSGSGASLTGIGVSALGGITGTPSSTTYLRGDGTWAVAAGGMTYPGAGIPNSTGSAWGTSYTTSGTGTVLALTTSPTFVTPNLGTPTSATLTNATGLPLSTGVTGTLAVGNGGTGVSSSTGTGSVVLSASPTLTGTVTGANSTWSGSVGIGTASVVGGYFEVYNGGFGTITTHNNLDPAGFTASTTWGTTTAAPDGLAIGINRSAGSRETDFVNVVPGYTPGGFRFDSWSGTTYANLMTIGATGTVTASTFSGAHTGSGSGLTGIGVSALGGITGTPSSTTYLRGDGTWATAGGAGQWTTGVGSDIYFNSGSAAIGATTANSTAILDLTSTTKGFLPPRMTRTQRDAISSPASGLIIYNTTDNQMNFYINGYWQNMTGSTVTSGNMYCWGQYPTFVPAAGYSGNYISYAYYTAGPTFLTQPSVYTSFEGNGGYYCGLTQGGQAFCTGQNGYGQLGIGTTVVPDANAHAVLQGGLSFTQLTTGYINSCALTAAGAAYCWGYNNNGEVGDGTNTQRTVPTAVAGGRTFSSIYAGTQSECALTSAGVAYCWGYNGYGSIGDGTNTSRNTPTAVAGGLTFTQLSLADSYSYTTACGLTSGGVAYCWGSNG